MSSPSLYILSPSQSQMSGELSLLISAQKLGTESMYSGTWQEEKETLDTWRLSTAYWCLRGDGSSSAGTHGPWLAVTVQKQMNKLMHNRRLILFEWDDRLFVFLIVMSSYILIFEFNACMHKNKTVHGRGRIERLILKFLTIYLYAKFLNRPQEEL